MKMLLLLILICLISVLVTFWIVVGFFVWLTRENPKQTYKKATQDEKTQNATQKAREEKAKREWQRFFNYDGSSNTDERNLK